MNICVLDFHDKSRDVMDKLPDLYLEINELYLCSRYYIHFQAKTIEKGLNPLYPRLWDY